MADDGSLPGLAGASALGQAGLIGEVAGYGVQAFAGYEAMGYEKNITNASQNIANLQQQGNAIKFAQSQIAGRRSALQQIRNAQISRSLALAESTNAGAQKGSGLQGGYGQVAGQAGTNLLAINQNLAYGKEMFDINNRISAEEQIISQNQGKVAMWQGIGGIGGGAASLGGSAIKSATNPSGSILGGGVLG